MVFGDIKRVNFFAVVPIMAGRYDIQIKPKNVLSAVHHSHSGSWSRICLRVRISTKQNRKDIWTFPDILLSLLSNAASDEVLIDFELAAIKTFEKALRNLPFISKFNPGSRRIWAEKIIPIKPRLVAGFETYNSFGLWITWKKVIPPSSWLLKIFKKYASSSLSTPVRKEKLTKCVHFSKILEKRKTWESLFPFMRIQQKGGCIENLCLNYKCGWRLVFWHPSVLFWLASKSVDNAGKFEEGRCNPRVSVFGVKSRFVGFEEKEVPRTEGEGAPFSER